MLTASLFLGVLLMLSSISFASPVRFAPQAQAKVQPQTLGVAPRPASFGNAQNLILETLNQLVTGNEADKSAFVALVLKVRDMEPTWNLSALGATLIEGMLANITLENRKIPDAQAATLERFSLVDQYGVPNSPVVAVVKEFFNTAR
jgi:hypothetical protein